MVKPAPFGNAEKLKRRKRIEALFAVGKNYAAFPVRVKYEMCQAAENGVAVQAGVSVSKKTFKRAVDRNRVKRLLREAYRLQKGPFIKAVSETNRQAALFFIYTGKTIVSFDVIYTAMCKCLHQLQQEVHTP